MSELIFMGQTPGKIIKDVIFFAYPLSDELIKEITDKVRVLYPEADFDVTIGHYEFGRPKIPIKITKK